MWRVRPSSNQIVRGIVAVGCAVALTLVLIAVWGILGEIALPALDDAARGKSAPRPGDGFWALVRLSLPFWAAALWLTAVGSFFDTGELYRVVRGGIWLVPAAICLAAVLIHGNGDESGMHLMGTDVQLTEADVILQ